MSVSSRTDEGKIAACKAKLRATIGRELRGMTLEDRAARSVVICARILLLDEWRSAHRVLLFTPMRSEPDIHSLADAAQMAGKLAVTVPSTARVESEFELPFTPDLVLVPGVAFSRDRDRMGRGGGFYDRLLAGRAREAFKLGVCFALQLRDEIPRAAHDVLLDAVISDC